MGRKRASVPSKFITYFQLLDALAEPGCPICRLLESGAIKALDSLMYEQVNDPATRETLVASHGFCNWHAWKLLDVQNSALGVALIYQHLLQEALDHLPATATQERAAGEGVRPWRTRARGRTPPPPFAAWRQGKACCPLCVMARGSERDMLTTVLNFLREPGFAEAFARSAGLCLPHLCLASEAAPDHPDLSTLFALHRARWHDLAWELGEFARMFDYRFAAETRGREGSSWQRALELFVGRSGAFGPERSSAPPPAATADIPAAAQDDEAAGSGPEPGATSPESLQFEVAALMRRVDALLAEREADRKARVALQLKVLALSADLKAMAAGVASAGPDGELPAPAETTEAGPPSTTGGKGGLDG